MTRSPYRTRALLAALPAILVLAAGLTLAAGDAAAHAVVIEAKPGVNIAVPGPELPVRIRYNSRIDASRSRLVLTKPNGEQVPVEPRQDSKPDEIEAVLTGLTPGGYRVRWQVLTLDGHLTRGDIPFRVVAP